MSVSPSFTCICLQKRLVLRRKEEIQKEQQEALQRLVEQYDCNASVVLGSGCIVSDGIAIGQAAGFAAVVSGTLEIPSVKVSIDLPGVASGSKGDKSVRDAETICHMYKKYGRMVPQKLKGDFSFVLFDPGQERVLAAVSPNSHVPLIQARGVDGCLLITTSPIHNLPPGSHSALTIPPGFLKYGWSSDPQQYSASLPNTPHRDVLTPSARAQAARLAFSGVLEEEISKEPQYSQTSVQTSGPSFESEGGEPQSPAPKKTRRGKRGGRNQKMRAESLKRMSVDELSRTSLEFPTLPSGTPSASSFSSRADERSWWRTNTPRQSLELSSFPSGSMPSSSLLDQQGSTPPSFRRFSMSATAPAFVPGQSGLFTRQSIPVVRARTTALSFPERTHHKKGFTDEAFYVAPQRISTEEPLESSMVSPFSDSRLSKEGERETAKAGKADAAWEDNPDSSASQQTAESQELQSQGPSSTHANRTVVDRGSANPSVAAQKLAAGSKANEGTEEVPRLPRVAIGSQSSGKVDGGVEGGSPKGGSPKGMSPGGSPTKPPRIPKNAFRHFLKAMIPKRSSQVDLWAEAGTDPTAHRYWAKSSSHGNLVGLHTGLQASGSGDLPPAAAQPLEAHTVAAREDTARQSMGRPHIAHEDQMLQNLKISDHPDANMPHPTAAQWLARKTRSMFGKSKSCTDLHQIDKQPTFLAVETEVK